MQYMNKLKDWIIDAASGPFGSNLKVDCFVEKGFPIIDGANLRGVHVTDNITKFVTEEKARSLSRSIAKRHDVIVTISGTLGQIAYIPNDSEYEEYLCSQRQFRVTFDETLVDVEYLTYYFHTNEGQKKILAFANYVGVPALSSPLPNFKNIEVDFPSIEKQHQIVSTLKHLDRKISLNRKANEVLESMAKQLYDYWFVQFDFPNAEGKPYKSSGGKMVYNETLKREIPEGWEVKMLSEIGTFKNGINYDPNEQGNTEYRIVNVRNVSSTSLLIDASELDILLLDEHKANTYLIKEGDILITRSGNPGATRRYCEHEIPAVYCGFIICFTPSFEIQHNYLLMFLKDRETITSRLKGGSIMPNISQDALKPINLPIPSTDILKKFEDSIVPILSKLQATISEIKYLTSLRDYLLPLLMNGQVKVL